MDNNSLTSLNRYITLLNAEPFHFENRHQSDLQIGQIRDVDFPKLQLRPL
jgi:hypothetical protein